MVTPGRWITIGLALFAASCLALAVAVPSVGAWWSVGETISIGPSGTTTCVGDDCRNAGLAWIGEVETWRRAGIATTVSALITAFALIALAAAQAARRRGALAAGAALTGALTAAVAGVVFVVTAPDLSAGGFGGGQAATIDRGLFVYAAGVLAAIAVAVIVLRRRA